MLDDQMGQDCVNRMGLPELPSRTFFQVSLRNVLVRLKAVPMRAICTLTPLGGAQNNIINQLIKNINQDIIAIAAETETSVLDLNERLWEEVGDQEKLGLSPEHKQAEYISDITKRMVYIVTACWKHYLGMQSWDFIATSRGSSLFVDRIHLSSKAATVVQEVVGTFLAAGKRK